MQTIRIDTSSRSYDVLVGTDLLGMTGEVARKTAGGSRAFVVSNVNVSPLYGSAVRRSLEEAGYGVSSIVVGAGEAIKNMHVLATVLEEMADAQLTRDDLVVALGGGVVGDLAGFAASIYMRGCKVIQVPTSLLAMVDSSVGGKTAVDLDHGKNLAGSFKQPRAVIASLDCLETISRDLFTDSCGEVIKYGVMADADLFDELSRSPINQGDLDLERVGRIVARCVELKRDVVNADERETGVRQILNLGHTVGHAIEAGNNYRLGHGSCVAAGTCVIARAAARLDLCDESVARQIEDVTALYGLPTSTELPVSLLFEQSLTDKKRHGDTVNVIVPTAIGSVEIKKVTLDEYREIIELGVRPL